MSEFGGLQKHEHIQHAPWVTKRDTVAAGPTATTRRTPNSPGASLKTGGWCIRQRFSSWNLGYRPVLSAYKMRMKGLTTICNSQNSVSANSFWNGRDNMVRLARHFSQIDFWHQVFQKLAYWPPSQLVHRVGLIWLYIHHKNQRSTVHSFFIMNFCSDRTPKPPGAGYGKIPWSEPASKFVV